MYEEGAKSPDADVQALAAKLLPGLRAGSSRPGRFTTQ